MDNSEGCASDTPFTYRDLNPDHDEIRLFRIKPAPNFDDPIQLDLSYHRFDERPEYLTVSYTWGVPFDGLGPEWDDPKFKLPITINGHRFSIRKNLFTALLHFRRTMKIGNPIQQNAKIWVDAICINQNDAQERSCQVRHIDRIYSSCRLTLIWLGPEDYPGIIAMSLLARAAAWAKDLRIEQLKIPELHSNIKVEIMTEGSPSHTEVLFIDLTLRYWDCLTSLIDRNWFCRAWVIQELALSPNPLLFCGPFWVSWCCVSALMCWFTRTGVEGGLSQRKLLYKLTRPITVIAFFETLSHHFRGTHALEPNISDLLYSLRTRKCEDPRDRVYAVLGLLQEKNLIVPDYRKPALQVFFEVARAAIESTRSLDILAYCLPHTQNAELPSWVPDWTADTSNLPKPFYRSRLGENNLEKRKLYKASLDTSLNLEFQDTPRSMVLHALFVSKISHIDQETRSSKNYDDSFHKITNMMERSVGAENQSFEGPKWLRNWLSTLAPGQLPKAIDFDRCDFVHEKSGWETSRQMRYLPTNQSLNAAFLSCLRVDVCVDPESLVVGRLSERKLPGVISVSDIFMMVDVYFFNRSFVASESGLIGLAPQWTEEGDIISIVKGNDIPLLLRPNEDGTFRFVGECYIHGIMDGEAVKDATEPFRSVAIV